MRCSAETIARLRRRAIGRWVTEPILLTDGRYVIEIDDDVGERLEEIAPGDPDTAIALCVLFIRPR